MKLSGLLCVYTAGSESTFSSIFAGIESFCVHSSLPTISLCPLMSTSLIQREGMASDVGSPAEETWPNGGHDMALSPGQKEWA